MNQNKRRHTKSLLLSHFQKWFIANSLLFFVSILGFLDCGIYLWYKVTASELLRVAGLLSPTMLQNMQRSVQNGTWILIATNLVIVGISTMHSVYFSKKIAGPIYALFNHLNKIKETGRWSPLKLRKGDLFDELPEKLDAAFTSVNHANDNTVTGKESKAS